MSGVTFLFHSLKQRDAYKKVNCYKPIFIA